MFDLLVPAGSHGQDLSELQRLVRAHQHTFPASIDVSQAGLPCTDAPRTMTYG